MNLNCGKLVIPITDFLQRKFAHGISLKIHLINESFR